MEHADVKFLGEACIDGEVEQCIELWQAAQEVEDVYSIHAVHINNNLQIVCCCHSQIVNRTCYDPGFKVEDDFLGCVLWC